MRILIYSETSEAKALQEHLRAERHHASLRNAQYFDRPDGSCDIAYADDERILNAYQSAGIAAHRITAIVEPITDAPADVEADEPAPKRKRR